MASAPNSTVELTPVATPEYVNYMDVKLHRVSGLPEEWLETAEGPSYSQHPFRYEVSLAIQPPAGTPHTAPPPPSNPIPYTSETPRGRVQRRTSKLQAAAASVTEEPKTVITFTHGRILTPVAAYTHYIENAMPPPVPGMDETSALQDIPEPLEVPGGTDMSAIGTTVSANTENMSLPLPAILWVGNSKTDIPPPSQQPEIPHSRRKQRRAGGGSMAATQSSGGAAVEATQPLPQLPEKTDPPPCVIRLPLDAEQEASIKSLLSDHQPLVLTFRRRLKAGVPADWEDFNAAYYQAKIPLSLSALAEPGSLKFTASVPLVPELPAETSATDHERTRKKASSRRSKSGVPPTLFEDPDPQQTHPYIASGTVAEVSLQLQHTLSRLVIDRVRPRVTPQQLIPTRIRNQRPPPTTAADVTREVKDAIETIARKILKDFRAMFAASGKDTVPASASPEERDLWRLRFLEFFQSTGQLTAYKAQLTPLVVRLVHERFLREPDASRETVSELSNELYVYLLECMHSTLRRLVSADTTKLAHTFAAPGTDGADPWKLRAEEAEASHEFTLSATYHQARIASCVETIAESEEGNSGGAKLRLLLAAWTDAGNFYVRVGDSPKAEQCYREAISCDPLHLPALLAYGMLLLAYNRLGEAAVFLHGAADVAPKDYQVWGCIALLDDLYILNLPHGSPTYAADCTTWQKERNSAMQQAIQWAPMTLPSHNTETTETSIVSDEDHSASSRTTGNSAAASEHSHHHPTDVPATPMEEEGTPRNVEEPSEAASAAATTAEERVCLDVARYASLLRHHDLASVCLARCQPDTIAAEHLYARLFVQARQYEDAIHTIAGIEAKELGSPVPSPCSRESILTDELRVLRAESEEELGREDLAIQSYKLALCKANASEIPPYLAALRDGTSDVFAESPEEADYYHKLFSTGYLHLGNLLLAAGKFRDALGAFTLGIQAWPCSLMWLGAGVAYYRMGTIVPAEECLNESSTLNPLNPRTWAYLSLLCIRSGAAEIETMVQQVMIEGLADAPLWGELGRELLLAAGKPQLAEVCLRKAIALAMEVATSKEDNERQRQLVATSRFHLANALIQMRRVDEAMTLFQDVLAHSQNEVLKAKVEQELRQLLAET